MVKQVTMPTLTEGRLQMNELVKCSEHCVN